MGRLLLGLAVVFCFVSCAGSGWTNKNKQATGEIDTVASRAPEGFYGFPWGTTMGVIKDSLGTHSFFETPYFVGYRNRDFGGRPASEMSFYFADGRLCGGDCTWKMLTLGGKNPVEDIVNTITTKYNNSPQITIDSSYTRWEWVWVWGDADKGEIDQIRLTSRKEEKLSLEVKCEYRSQKAKQQYEHEKMNRDF